jgi:hypothetical protein
MQERLSGWSESGRLSDLRLICCASGGNGPYLPVFSCPLCASKTGKSILVFLLGSLRSLKSDSLLVDEATGNQLFQQDCVVFGAFAFWGKGKNVLMKTGTFGDRRIFADAGFAQIFAVAFIHLFNDVAR